MDGATGGDAASKESHEEQERSQHCYSSVGKVIQNSHLKLMTAVLEESGLRLKKLIMPVTSSVHVNARVFRYL